MKKICSLIMVAFLLSVNVANAADANLKQAKKWTEIKGNELLNTFSISNTDEKYKKLDDIFNNYVDVKFVGRFSLGKYYRQLNSEQEKIYLDLFRRYCLSSYKKLPLSFAKEITFNVDSVKKENKNYVVKARVNVPLELQQEEGKNDLEVYFYLKKSKNDFLINDIKVMEVSLLLSFRNKFTKMVFDSDSEIDWFLEDLEALVARAESGLKKEEVY